MASLSTTAALARLDWRQGVTGPLAVLVVWALYSALAVALLPLTGWEPGDPDDYMRLLQVRDLLAGQSWFDVTQYRMNPPHGASMHWSRLVDVPLAGLIAVAGELPAMVLAPLLYLIPALFALRSIMVRLGFPPLALLIGLVLLPLFPLLPSNFAPLRIDHHTPQAVAAICCAALLLQDSRRSAIFCGLLAAAWLAISLEALPLVAAIAGLYGLRYWLARDRLLPYFLGALAVAAPLFSLATRPLSALSEQHCDILLTGHMAAFGAAAAVSLMLQYAPWQDRAAGRLAALALIPLVCMPLATGLLGRCLADPFAEMDPLLQTYWHGFIIEGLPFWRQPPSVALMLLWTAALVPAGYWLARRLHLAEGDRAMAWIVFALLALAAGAYSMWLMRAGLAAQLLAIPFSALLLGHYLPKARAITSALPRIAATLGVLALATPTFASAVLKPFDELSESGSLRSQALDRIEGGACDYSQLAALPKGHIFAPLDRGPEILVRTGHTIVMAGYHRNQDRMRDVVAAYTGDPIEAERIVRANRPDYLIACTSGKDVAVFRTARADNLANSLSAGAPPTWLEPVRGFTAGSLKVYRLMPAAD